MAGRCKRAISILSGTAAAFALVVSAPAADEADPLVAGFLNPPNSAKPRVWWHWMNGNITKEGIQLDLEWMNRIGIGGFQNFDAALGTPQVVDKRLVYMTPEWQDAFRYAMTLADQLGLEASIAGSPGWSESGGPWVPPSEAMKKLVWSEMRVEGGRAFKGKLPKPPTVSGPYQDLPLFDFIAAMSGHAPPPPPEYYADSAVVAYRLPAADVATADLQAKVTSSAGTIDARVLDDGDLVRTTGLPVAPIGERAWIQFEYPKPASVQSVTLLVGGGRNPFADVIGGTPPGPDFEASDDGKTFRKIAQLPNNGALQNTVAFARATARYFRVTFTTQPPPPPSPVDFGELGFTFPPAPKDYPIAELVLHADARVNRAEEKAGFGFLRDFDDAATPSIPPSEAIRLGEVLDLTSKLHADGTLDWKPPAGQWVVLRMGYSLTGVTNHPASPEGTGFEVDKLNAGYVKKYMDTYLDLYRKAAGPLMGEHGLRCLISDSYEAGAQNWTDDLAAQFSRRRGYDLRPWLPVLTGRVVESAEASDRFLWDFRKTLGDLIAESHYGQVTASVKERGLCHYGESHEAGRAFIGDGMDAKRSNDIPMGAMWTQAPGVNRDQPGCDADIRESASVAHLYGQNLVAAESMTAAAAPYAWSPATLKPTADKELAMGLNRFVIHTSVHQPLIDKAPGLGLGPFGQWFTRNETWAEPAKAWVSYLARSSYLLQQGHFAADVGYYYGEDSNITALFGGGTPDVPAGYAFDYVNADALLRLLSVKDGRLVTPSGMSYRILALDPRNRVMTLPVLRKIRELVAAGAVVVGPKPVATPSLSDDAAEFRALADEVWGQGKGKVYGRQSIAEALAAEHVAPDFEYTKPKADTNLLFVHRKLADGEIYFVNNRSDRSESLQTRFRVDGRIAELWHADTGTIEPASYSFADGRTTVPLELDPWDAVFVVFRKLPPCSPALPKKFEPSQTIDLVGPWDVSFQAGRGAPAKIILDKLASWSESAAEGVKYFSGTGTYTKSFQVPPGSLKPGARVSIDLGDVESLAEVSVNGQPFGTLWKRPFRLDITAALKPGRNTISIAVTNLWVNRLIGDRQPGATKPYTYSMPQRYKADAPLLPSGLIGPVHILLEKRVP